MSEVKEYTPGTFCWPELVATDSDKAKEFYKGLFNWDITDNPIGDDRVYSMASLGEKSVAGIYQMFKEQSDMGVPPHWGSYVSVSDLDESLEKAQSADGVVVVGPMDVFDAGRMAAIQDPTGGMISLWQPLKHIGAERVNENGALVWNEFMTNDTEKATEFYTELFGWTAQVQDFKGMDYTIFMNGERPAGGMMEIQKEWGEMPPTWFVYFAVDDCDAAFEHAQSLGGEEVLPPMNLEGVGRIAFIKDSQGAAFAVIKLINPLD